MSASQILLFSHVAVGELTLRCIYASIMFVPVFVCSLLLRGRRPYLQLSLWSLVLIRALLPSDFNLPFSVRELISALDMQFAVGANVSLNCLVSPLCLHTWSIVPGVSNQISLSVLAALWLCVALWSIWRFCAQRLFYSRLLRHAQPATHPALLAAVAQWKRNLGVERNVELRVGEAALPFTMGVIRPKIYLPSSLANGDKTAIAVVVGHEMAHIKRYDDFWVCLCRILQALYFFFPPIRFALKQMALQRERVCDQLVVTRGNVDAREYAHYLLAACAETGRHSDSVAGLSARAAVYSSRIAAVAEASNMGVRGMPLALLMLVAAFLFVLPMAPQLPATPLPAVAMQSVAQGAFTPPLAHYEIGSRHGKVFSMPVLGRHVHTGVDLIAAPGSSILAMADGTVERRVMQSSVDGTYDRYGSFLVVRHGDYLVYYTDLDSVRVEAGAAVRRGQVLGTLAHGKVRTRQGQPRLHLEVFFAGASIDPLRLFTASEM